MMLARLCSRSALAAWIAAMLLAADAARSSARQVTRESGVAHMLRVSASSHDGNSGRAFRHADEAPTYQLVQPARPWCPFAVATPSTH